MESHPEIFNIPNFISIKKRMLRQKGDDEGVSSNAQVQKREVSPSRDPKVIEREQKERALLYKRVRGWIQSAMDELEARIAAADIRLSAKDVEQRKLRSRSLPKYRQG